MLTSTEYHEQKEGPSMKELIEYIAKSLVDDPSQVRVDEIQGTTSVVLELLRPSSVQAL